MSPRSVPDARLAYGFGHWLGLVLGSILLALLLVHAVGVLGDFAASIRYPFELEYGEGIVWQQAALIPGPRMYSKSPDLPFIVFHYPPLYHLLARAALSIEPSFLAAGRLVSSVSAVLVALAVAGLVLIAADRSTRPVALAEWTIAIMAGLLVLCLGPVRSWGSWMRVDMAAIALGMIGLFVGAWANGRFWGTLVALLLCAASVFTKQTQLPVGVAVFLVALLRNPRGALGAVAIAGTFALAALGLMEWLTVGGFLHNIVGDNINRFALIYAVWVLWSVRDSFLVIVLIAVAAGAVFRGLWHWREAAEESLAIRQRLSRLRRADRATTARAMLLLNFALASLTLFSLFKSGSSSSYLLGWLCVGGVLIGVWLCDLVGAGSRFSLVTALLILGVLSLPLSQITDQFLPQNLERQAALVRRIAEADKPVASEDMTLLMLAGKPVMFEPAIVSELASVGRWDEGPLVNLIRTGGFAFMITRDNAQGANPHRTAAVDAAMRAAYPRVERVGPLWLHLPVP